MFILRHTAHRLTNKLITRFCNVDGLFAFSLTQYASELQQRQRTRREFARRRLVRVSVADCPDKFMRGSLWWLTVVMSEQLIDGGLNALIAAGREVEQAPCEALIE
jgi:hypothetical protein